MYLEAMQRNYGTSGDDASRFFDQAQRVANSTKDVALRNVLQQILGLRDQITSDLAKGNAAVVSEMVPLLLKVEQGDKAVTLFRVLGSRNVAGQMKRISKSLALQGGECGENRCGRQSDRVRDDAPLTGPTPSSRPRTISTSAPSEAGTRGSNSRAPLGRDPQRPTGSVGGPPMRPCASSSRRSSGHAGLLRPSSSVKNVKPQERVVQLVERGCVGPCLVAHPRDRIGVELAEIRRGGRIDPAPAHHRLRPALLERRIVEIGIGARVQRLESERRRLGEVARDHPHLAASRGRAGAARTHRCPSHPRDNRGWSGAPADGPEPRSRPADSRRTRLDRETPHASKSCACMRAICGGIFLPPRKRGNASAMPASQRQRTSNIGAAHSACTRTCRTELECR